MISKPIYFDLHELVCPHAAEYGEFAWNFIDPRLLLTLDRLRGKLNKPIIINNWKEGGEYSQRGLRCLRCDLVKAKIQAGEMYMSAHLLGRGADFSVQGLVASEVREYIIKNKNLWPYPIRLEKDVSWVHLDIYDMNEKVYLF